ncbi:SDR family NAD(P)-dependent oxidoreductase, partial [Clostridium perfringens]
MNMEKFSLDFFKLDGKVAIVTGGNTGLGMAYVEALAAAGADVLVTTFDNNTEEVKNIVESLGRKIVFVQGDLTKKETRDKVVSTCLEEFGKIDILVNNAGTIRRAPLLEYKDEDWQAVMDINLNSVYYLSQAVAKVMAKQGYG